MPISASPVDVHRPASGPGDVEQQSLATSVALHLLPGILVAATVFFFYVLPEGDRLAVAVGGDVLDAEDRHLVSRDLGQ